jgi:hypothetical protein
VLAALRLAQHTLIEQFLRRPSVKEHRANLEAILKRDCSDTLAGPVNRTLKLGTWPSYGDKEIDTRFEEFALQEIRISQRPCEDLVKPSGKLSAPLFLQLHYPTFRSQRPFYGDVSDETTPSVGFLVTQKGLRATDGILFSEASFRREKPIATVQNGQNGRTSHIRPQYPECYPAKLSLVHQQFSEWMMDHSQAKVVVQALP